jgi:D-alanyl-lipoteichoic acid acyltransferase DltB (MBOAT superfamily)
MVKNKHQWIVLLLSSYIFYLASGVKMMVFLLFATLVTYFAALLLENSNKKLHIQLDQENKILTNEQKKKYRAGNKKRKSLILTISLILIFGVLGFVKYYNDFSLNIASLLKLFSYEVNLPKFNILLPLGISFFTFQSAGYIIDVNRGKIKADRNLLKFALFVSFFPQIVQGPISRYDQLAHQFYEPHPFNFDQLKSGLLLVLWGFFKKLVIADRLAIAVNAIFTRYDDFSGLSIYFGILLFSFQMYCDFSGGMDIARGIAESMGINLEKNFERPFFSTSLDNFWRRWHITLGSWMRDYVFYPLSISKGFLKFGRFTRRIFGTKIGKLIPTMIAMVITFLLVGVWHGPEWKYIAFGLYHGTLLSIGIFLTPFKSSMNEKLNINPEKMAWKLLSILWVFFLTTIGRYFILSDGFRHALWMLKRTFTNINLKFLTDGTLMDLDLAPKGLGLVLTSIAFLIIIEIFQERGVHFRKKIANQKLVVRWSIYLIGIFVVLIFGIYGINYNPSDFIYRMF